MNISWTVVVPKKKSLWDTVVQAYGDAKNRKAIAAGIEALEGRKLTQKQLDKMIHGTEGRQLAVRLLEAFLDSLDGTGRTAVMDYLDWKYRVPAPQQQEKINDEVREMLAEVHRLLDLHERGAR